MEFLLIETKKDHGDGHGAKKTLTNPKRERRGK
jgi:hypothetical protein